MCRRKCPPTTSAFRSAPRRSPDTHIACGRRRLDRVDKRGRVAAVAGHADRRGCRLRDERGCGDRSPDREPSCYNVRRDPHVEPAAPPGSVAAPERAPRRHRARPAVSGPATNDLIHPVPRTELPKGRMLEFDFPGLEIGVAEYEEGPTGCTMFHLRKVASLSIDVRGGSPGVNEQHLNAINAICFAG